MLFVYLFIFLFGLVVGSFLNVLILRVPVKESLLKRSHCTGCGHTLSWYDLFPLFSFLLLKGRCRYCNRKISWQYPMVEFFNGLFWVLTFAFCGPEWETCLKCLVISALLALSVIDERTKEIPVGFNIFIAVMGCVNLALNIYDWKACLLGAVSVSAFLLLLYYMTKGRGIGGGDIKLMAAAGLFLGLKLTLVAFFIGLVLACVIHLLRMKLQNKAHELAMGPYLSAGILLSIWFGERIAAWYLGFFS